MTTQTTFQLMGNSTGFIRAINRSVGGMRRFSSGMRKTQKAVFKAAKVIATLQTNMLGMQAVMKGFTAVKTVVMDFANLEEALFKIRAVTGSTDDEMKGLRKIIDDLGMSTQFTTDDIAKAIFNLGTLGIKGPKAFDALMPSITAAATALDLDLNRAAEIVLSTMKTFDLEMGESARVADVLTAAYTNSALNAEKWAISQQFAGLAAKAFDRDIEDIIPLLMSLSDQGIDASIAATQIRTAFLSLINPTTKARKTLAEIGLTLDDMDVKQHGFIGVLENLEKGYRGIGDAARIFNVRSAAIIDALIKTKRSGEKGTDVLKKYQKTLFDSGIAARHAEQRQQGLSFAIKVLDASFGQFKITIGETLEDWFNLSGMTDILSGKLAQLSQILKGVDFEVLKGAALEIFDPDEIAQNIENGLQNVVPAAISLIGSIMTFGALTFLDALGKFLPGILIGAGNAFASVVIQALSAATQILINVGEKLTIGMLSIIPGGSFALRGTTEELFEGFKKSSSEDFSDYAKGFANKKVDVSPDKIKQNFDQFLDSFGDIATQEQRSAVNRLVQDTKSNMAKQKEEGQIKKAAISEGKRSSLELREGSTDLTSQFKKINTAKETEAVPDDPKVVVDNSGQINHNYREPNRTKMLVADGSGRTPRGDRKVTGWRGKN